MTAENPFEAPQEENPARYRPSRDPTVDHEPHLLNEEFMVEVPHQVRPLHLDATREEAVEHTVWEEPALSPTLSGVTPNNALTYARWLAAKIELTPLWQTWVVTFLAGLASGAVAFVASWFWGIQFGRGFLGQFLVLPMLQELLKVAVPLWIVERRPYLFRFSSQIAIAALVGGIVFVALESVYLLQTTRWLPGWSMQPWSMGGLAHVACSGVASIGLIQIWREAIRSRRPPRLAAGAPFLVGAIAFHILAEAFALLVSLSGRVW